MPKSKAPFHGSKNNIDYVLPIAVTQIQIEIEKTPRHIPAPPVHTPPPARRRRRSVSKNRKADADFDNRLVALRAGLSKAKPDMQTVRLKHKTEFFPVNARNVFDVLLERPALEAHYAFLNNLYIAEKSS